MYISSTRSKDKVIVWERRDGVRLTREFPAPLYFYVQDEDGKHSSIWDDPLRKESFTSQKDFQAAKDDFKASKIKLYESDIPAEIKVLSEHYNGADLPKLNITFLDIEVDVDDKKGFASVENPYADIISVAFYHNWLNKYVVLAIPTIEVKDVHAFKVQLNSLEPLEEGSDYEIILCNSEFDLLVYLLDQIEDSDLVVGFNSEAFDMPYIGKRLENYGKKYFNKLSFDGAKPPKWKKMLSRFGQEIETIITDGRICVDYLVLYKKFEVIEKRSFKLEAIAEEVLPTMRKMKYTGKLSALYRNNFPFFVRYNIRDTEILKAFEDKLGYVELANMLCHLTTAPWSYIPGTLKMAEAALINYCHNELGKVVGDNENIGDDGYDDDEFELIDEEEDDFDDFDDYSGWEEEKPKKGKGISGAYVLDPKVGMHEWIGSIDVASLYPSSIRAINVSPETLIGQFEETERAVEEIKKETETVLHLRLEKSGETKSTTAKNWRRGLIRNKMSISGYGTVFSQKKIGFVPSILTQWFTLRKEYQKEKGKYEEEAKLYLEKDKDKYDELKEKAAYYDRLQYVMKIRLNALYGALVNKYFRFYDKRLGESTTCTGRIILQHQCAEANRLLDGEYKFDGNAILYGDTDSSYFLTYADNQEEAIQTTDIIAKKVNGTFKEFMEENFLCTEGYSDLIKTSKDIVSDRGIFCDKKRYILHMVEKEGFPPKKGKEMKTMGVELKKTALPKEISDRLSSYIERLLKGESWEEISLDIVALKEALTELGDIMAIGLPKGIKKSMVEYEKDYGKRGSKARLPGTIAAAIHYNQCLKMFKDPSPPIVAGIRVRLFYLTKKYGRFKSIALPADIEEIPQWFKDHFVIDRLAHIERLVDKPLDNILKAIKKKSPTKQQVMSTTFFDF